MELNKEQISILDHTVKRAAGQRYCGGGPDMNSLVEAGLMKAIGKPSWCPDEFFSITKEGMTALENNKGEKIKGTVEYWDCDDNTEMLTHQDFDEAVEAFLDDRDPEDTEEIIDVFGYAREVIDPAKFTASILESAYDWISEDHDGEDGHEQCQEIQDAAKAFVETYLKNYKSWSCKIVHTEKVNTKEWILKNAPHWLEQKTT